MLKKFTVSQGDFVEECFGPNSDRINARFK